MDRIRSLAIGTLLIFALAVLAQNTPNKPSTSSGGGAEGGGLPPVEEQLKVLTDKLDLTATQRTRVRPIMQDLHDATEKLMAARPIRLFAYLVAFLTLGSGISLAASGPAAVAEGTQPPAALCFTDSSFAHRGASYTSFRKHIAQLHCQCCGKDENGHCNHQCCN